VNWSLLQNSLLVAGTTTALAICLGLAAALWLATLESRPRNVFLAIAIVALALPPFLVTNCWMDLLGGAGVWRAWLPLNIFSLGGSVWILSLLLWPITTLLLLSGWRRLEAAQLECDPALTGFALVRALLLPVDRGELTLAAVITSVLALNNFAVPVLLQTNVLPEEMWIRFNTAFDTVGALLASLPLVLAPLVLLAACWRQQIPWPRLQGSVPAKILRRQLGTIWLLSCGVLAGLLCALSVGLPLADIAFAARTWAELPGAIEAGTAAIWNSFWFAALAATLVTSAAIVLILRSSRGNEAHSSSPVTSTATIIGWLTFFIPGVLLGIAFIKLFNRPGLTAFYQSAGIVILAFVIRYFALGWTASRHAIASVDPDLTDAATLEGASRWQLLRFVIWPQIAPQVLAAWYVVYLLCLWDVESMVLIVPPGGETLALRIFNLLHYGHAAQVNALCLTLLGVAVLPLLLWSVAKWILEKSANFRSQTLAPTSGFGVLNLALLWILVLGAWCFSSGCSPSDGKPSVALPSQFFDRAQVIGSRGVGVGEFNKPRSVTVDRADNLYAVDITGRVQKFSPAGEFLLSWQMLGIDRGRPKGMCCDADGNIVVGEPHYQRVNHFTTDGKLLRQWGVAGTNAGQLTFPRSEAVNSRGELLLSEYTTVERVQVFRSRAEGAGSLDLIRTFGQPGTGEAEFNRAEGICVDGQDRIFVADSCNHRIQIFSPDGKFIRQYGRAGSGLGELSYPYDIKVDASGNQFVCEFGNSRIQVFDANCQPVEIIGGPGGAPGSFANPWSVALDSHGSLYVADSQNHRVQKLVRRMGALGFLQSAEVADSRTTHHALR
jgi:ABC-type Fe3+ transport system permease subunit/sugar lactone lactonase YvrE